MEIDETLIGVSLEPKLDVTVNGNSGIIITIYQD